MASLVQGQETGTESEREGAGHWLLLSRLLGPGRAERTYRGVSGALTQLSPWPLTGTFVSAFTVLCGARTDLPDRHVCCVFWLNIAAALIQILTAIVMVGWIMSIFWGMDMVILASE